MEGKVLLSIGTEGRCALHRLDPDAPSIELDEGVDLPDCPRTIEPLSSGDLLLRHRDGTGRLVTSSVRALEGSELLAAGGESRVRRAGGRLIWEREGTGRELPSELETVSIAPDGSAVIAFSPTADGGELVRIDLDEAGALRRTVLADDFRAVRELAFDRDGKELVVSAIPREAGSTGRWDIALVNAEAPVMNWVPADMNDEVAPLFSPFGYKISYIVRSTGGDVIRTVHVPTAAMVLATFGSAKIHDYAWMPDGERLIVALSSPLVSDHLVEINYAGVGLRELIGPEIRIEREADRLPGAPAGSILLSPESLAYGERHPLVIWTTGPDRDLAFDPRLVPLLDRGDIGVLLIEGSVESIEPALWDALPELGWVDQNEIWLVAEEDAIELPDTIRRLGRYAGVVADLLESIDRKAR